MAEKLFDIDANELFKIIDALKDTPKEIRPAIAHAVNKTLETTQTKIKKEVTSEYAIKQKVLTAKDGKGNKPLKLERANVNNLTGAAVSTGYQIATYKFPHIPKATVRTKYGVKVQVKKGGGKKPISFNGNKAFKINVHSNSMVFARKGKERYPIKKLYALSVPQMISDMSGKKDSIRRIQEHAARELPKKVDQEINYRLDKIIKERGVGK